MNPLSWLLLKVVRFYQLVISPLTPPTCRYFPSCSAYAIESIRVNGVVRGSGQAIWRVLRCNPWSDGGVDFPPNSDMEVPIPPDPQDLDTPEEMKAS